MNRNETTQRTTEGDTNRDRVLRLAWKALRKANPASQFPKAPPAWYTDRLCEAAHHEAGHVAAYAFFDSSEPFVLGVTIIPKDDYAGSVSMEGFYRLIRSAPSVAVDSFLWGEELRSMLIDIAGDAARAKASGDDTDFDAWMESSGNQELLSVDGVPHVESKRRGDMSDEEKAWASALGMANGEWSPHRIAQMAHSLAVDLLAIPEVWACVCAIADQLLTKGELGCRELRQLCAPIRGMVRALPKWREQFDAFVRTNRWDSDELEPCSGTDLVPASPSDAQEETAA